MSIIYEALKKVEKSRDSAVTEKTEQKKISPPKRIVYLIYALVVVFGIFSANIIFSIFTKSAATRPAVIKSEPMPIVKTTTPLPPPLMPAVQQPIIAPKTVEPPLPPSPPQLALNGLFFSENQGYVLINNQILKEGDKIEGAIVKRITLDGVELDWDGSTIKLNTAK